MNKLNRTMIAIALALITLFAVVPTVTTASADSYSSGSNNGAKDAAYVVGGVAAAGVLLVLFGHKKSGSDTSGS